jgi:hypothetical protein
MKTYLINNTQSSSRFSAARCYADFPDITPRDARFFGSLFVCFHYQRILYEGLVAFAYPLNHLVHDQSTSALFTSPNTDSY